MGMGRWRRNSEGDGDGNVLGHERIDPENGGFTGAELNPTPEEIKARVITTIKKFEYTD